MLDDPPGKDAGRLSFGRPATALRPKKICVQCVHRSQMNETLVA
jgi:hypothetical protein